MFSTNPVPGQLAPLKESIRDVARLQQTYAPSDELLWVYFNVRVLQNEPLDLITFAQQTGLWQVVNDEILPVAVG